MRLRLVTLFASFAFCAILTTSLHGALVVTSENFNDPGAAEPGGETNFGFEITIADWGESVNVNGTGGAFNDFLGAGSSFTGLNGNAAGLSTAGYIYREIGTQDSFLSIGVSGISLTRDNGQRNTIGVELFSLPASDPFAFAEVGNDIADEANAVSLGEFVSSDPANMIGATAPFSFSYDVSGVANGDRLFVRLRNTGLIQGQNAPSLGYVDNLAFTAVVIPEPSSFLAIGLVGIASFTRRKR
ncbi:PEP-CTERM sorting domain-containing protein [Rubripirellula obstinata]|nr:PEP-CTERM sorting domain-containing protein [Rubripirellula obstinata]